MNRVKITDREAFERLLKGEEVYHMDIYKTKLDEDGNMECTGSCVCMMGRFYAPEPIREYSGKEALGLLLEGCLLRQKGNNTGLYRWLENRLEYKTGEGAWITSQATVSKFVLDTFTLCRPDGTRTNNKEEARG